MNSSVSLSRAMVVAIGALILVGCPAPRAADSQAVVVQLPEAYELANIVLALTEYGQSDRWEVRKDFPYYDEVLAHFTPYMDHPLLTEVNYSRERWREYLSFRTDAMAFAFDDAGQLHRNIPFVTHSNISPFDDQLTLVNDFVRVSDFRPFFAEHADYYRSIVDAYATYYMVQPMLHFLRTAVGETRSGGRHVITLSPLVYRMNAHRDIDDSTSGDFPTLADYLVGKGPAIEDALSRATDIHTILTEMDHGFVNPISDAFARAIDSLFDHTVWQVDAGYDTPRSTFDEYVTWAIYDLFVEEEFPDLADEVSLYWHYQNKRRGFVYSWLFGQRLRTLYHRRTQGERLGDVYPALLAWAQERQATLSQPVLVQPADSVRATCGGPSAMTLEFSEPMAMADSVALIVQDGRQRLDTLLLTRQDREIEWSTEGLHLMLHVTIPAVDNPYLVFNWWGARVPLVSREGVLLESPTSLRVVCE